MEFELNKSKAIDGNHVSCFGFSIALRGFKSRPGHWALLALLTSWWVEPF